MFSSKMLIKAIKIKKIIFIEGGSLGKLMEFVLKRRKNCFDLQKDVF